MEIREKVGEDKVQGVREVIFSGNKRKVIKKKKVIKNGGTTKKVEMKRGNMEGSYRGERKRESWKEK